MNVADRLEPLLQAALGGKVALRVEGWDGSVAGPDDAEVRLIFRNRRALRRIVWSPNEIGFARAYVSGDLDVDGELFDTLAALERAAITDEVFNVNVHASTRRELASMALRLGALGRPPKPPAEEARLRGSRHSKRRDASAISHHYDVGNDFYRIVLGSSMTYSCAYFASEDMALADAQFAKCDLVARKLGLQGGMRILDVGCGWGTFALHAARTYGVRVVGVTLSQEQAAYARERMAAEGVADLVEIRIQDYRDITDGPFDAISSIGMAEHVGASMLPVYAADLFSLLRPEGRLLNHAISRRPGAASAASGDSFIGRYVFPDGELETMATMVEALEDAGFEVRDVESLREHYGQTLRHWVANLVGQWDEAARLTSVARARIWHLYMAGSALAFEANHIGLNQVLAVKPTAAGHSAMPRTRDSFLG